MLLLTCFQQKKNQNMNKYGISRFANGMKFWIGYGFFFHLAESEDYFPGH